MLPYVGVIFVSFGGFIFICFLALLFASFRDFKSSPPQTNDASEYDERGGQTQVIPVVAAQQRTYEEV
jgi:hypothetical protein